MCFSSKVQVKWNLLENFAFQNMWKKDKGWSLQKVFQFFWSGISKKALKFKTLGRFIKTKKMYMQYKTLELKTPIIRVCIPMQKKPHWFENLVFAQLVSCGFSVKVKSFVLQSLTLPETAVYKNINFEKE